jgi:malate synthase
MEDAATAEISIPIVVAQNRVKLDSNRNLTKDYYYRLAMEEYEKIKN